MVKKYSNFAWSLAVVLAIVSFALYLWESQIWHYVFPVAVIANVGALAVTWKKDSSTLERLENVADLPTPSTEEIKAYRKEHPDRSLMEAVADIKEQATHRA